MDIDSPMGTPELILNATRECLLQVGYHATTIKKIAQKAGVNQGLIHHHFESKENLFCVLLESTETAINQRMEQHADKRALFREFKHEIAVELRLFVEFNAMAPHLPAVARVLRRSIRKRMQRVQSMMELGTESEAFFILSFMAGVALLHVGYPDLPLQELQEHFLTRFPGIECI